MYSDWAIAWCYYEIINIPSSYEKLSDIPESTNQDMKETRGSTVRNSKVILKLKPETKDHSELQHI